MGSLSTSVAPTVIGPPASPSPKATPFIKWAGGKAQLLGQLAHILPKKTEYETYLEPFLGGGAVFFHLLPPRAILSDVNDELINVYRVVQTDVELLIDELRKHDPHRFDRKYFEKIRDEDPSLLDPLSRAARTIFLNKTCYNGLYRVNARGKFNVPFGDFKNPLVLDPENLRRGATALRGKLLLAAGYETATAYARRGDFVYLDPPYDPVSGTANFTRYTQGNFGVQDQKKLADVVKTLDKRGCQILVSNSDTPLIRELYAEFQIKEVEATRVISSNTKTRGKIRELLVLNYSPQEHGRNGGRA